MNGNIPFFQGRKDASNSQRMPSSSMVKQREPVMFFLLRNCEPRRMENPRWERCTLIKGSIKLSLQMHPGASRRASYCDRSRNSPKGVKKAQMRNTVTIHTYVPKRSVQPSQIVTSPYSCIFSLHLSLAVFSIQ